MPLNPKSSSLGRIRIGSSQQSVFQEQCEQASNPIGPYSIVVSKISLQGAGYWVLAPCKFIITAAVRGGEEGWQRFHPCQAGRSVLH